MKLYTEKEIRKAILIGSIHLKSKTIDELVKSLTPIELPSDDEIEEETKGFMFEKNKAVFCNGAKWQEQKTIEEVFEWLTTNNYLTDLKETLIENFKNR